MKNIRSLNYDTVCFKDFVIINFWPTWCKSCLEEQPFLEGLAKSMPSVKVYQISFDSLDLQSEVLKKRGGKLSAYYISNTMGFSMPDLSHRTVIIKNNKIMKEFHE